MLELCLKCAGDIAKKAQNVTISHLSLIRFDFKVRDLHNREINALWTLITSLGAELFSNSTF
jgi:hypothetical protein